MKNWLSDKWQRFQWLVIILLVLTIGYFLGSYAPYSEFKFHPQCEALTRHDYWRLVISIVAACFTFLAIVVALFKEQIVSAFRSARVLVVPPQNAKGKESFISESLDLIRSDSESSSKNRTFKIYVRIHNKGNLEAKDTMLRLKSIDFTPKDTESALVRVNEGRSGAAFKWSNGSFKDGVPPREFEDIMIAELKQSINSSPQAESERLSFLYICGEQMKEKDGIWSIALRVSSENTSIIRTVNIAWDGIWADSMAEICSHLTISIHQ